MRAQYESSLAIKSLSFVQAFPHLCTRHHHPVKTSWPQEVFLAHQPETFRRIYEVQNVSQEPDKPMRPETDVRNHDGSSACPMDVREPSFKNGLSSEKRRLPGLIKLSFNQFRENKKRVCRCRVGYSRSCFKLSNCCSSCPMIADEAKQAEFQSLPQESKDWIADPKNRICDAPGSWYCSFVVPTDIDRTDVST